MNDTRLYPVSLSSRDWTADERFKSQMDMGNDSQINETNVQEDYYMDMQDVIPRRLPPLLKVSLPMALILTTAYFIVFILAVVNNSLIVSLIWRSPQMRNVTNFFLANLAAADITVSFIVLPITLLSNLFYGKCFSIRKQMSWGNG